MCPLLDGHVQDAMKQQSPEAEIQADPDHNFVLGECRFADMPPPSSRIGQHPREPRQQASTHPSAEASSHDVTREDPGVPGDMHPVAEAQEPAGQASGSSSGRGRPEGSVDTVPRTRRTYTDTELAQPDYRTGHASTFR